METLLRREKKIIKIGWKINCPHTKIENTSCFFRISLIIKAINSSESHPMKILQSLVSIDPVVSEEEA